LPRAGTPRPRWRPAVKQRLLTPGRAHTDLALHGECGTLQRCAHPNLALYRVWPRPSRCRYGATGPRAAAAPCEHGDLLRSVRASSRGAVPAGGGGAGCPARAWWVALLRVRLHGGGGRREKRAEDHPQVARVLARLCRPAQGPRCRRAHARSRADAQARSEPAAAAAALDLAVLRVWRGPCDGATRAPPARTRSCSRKCCDVRCARVPAQARPEAP